MFLFWICLVLFLLAFHFVQLLLSRVLGHLNQYKLIRGQTRNSGKALLKPLLKQQGVRTNNELPCLLPLWGGWASSLHGSEGRGVSKVLVRGVASVICPPLVTLCAVGHAEYPAFALNPRFCSQLVSSSSWTFLVFLHLLSRICLKCSCTQLFLVPYGFFVYCSSRRWLSSASFGAL